MFHIFVHRGCLLRHNLSSLVMYRSLGCTVVEMLSGKPPWHKLEGAAVVYEIGKTKKPTYELPDDVSSASKAFIECCFKHDPSSRPSADDLLRDDPFICDASTLCDKYVRL